MKRIFRLIANQSFILLVIFLIILSVLYSTLSIIRHMQFQSGGFDLGLYDQAVWKFAHFLDPYNTVKERLLFGDHLVLTLPLFGILFFLWEDVRMLLIAQAVIISFSAIPIYLLAKKRMGSPIAALCLAIIYSLFYGIQYGVYFDFHPIIIGVAALSWLAYFWETGNKRLFWISVIFALLTQENMGIALICLSSIFFFRKEFRKQAIIIGLLGLGYSLIASKIIAHFSPVGFQYWPQFPNSPVDAISRLFDSQEKRQVWWYSYSSFSFLPLFSPGALIAVLIDISQYFVTGPEFSRMWSPFMHHRAILAPLLTLGTIDVLVFLKTKKIRITFIAVGLLFITVSLQYIFHLPLNKLTKTEYWKHETWMIDTEKMLLEVPGNASVSTQQNLVPHLSHRKQIYIAWPRPHNIEGEPCGQRLCWWIDSGGKPEYLVVDTRPDQWLTQILESNDHWLSAVSNMEKVGRITLEKEIGTMRMYLIHWDKGIVN
jgi:uncharacterized membrane protein